MPELHAYELELAVIERESYIQALIRATGLVPAEPGVLAKDQTD